MGAVRRNELHRCKEGSDIADDFLAACKLSSSPARRFQRLIAAELTSAT